MESDESAGDAQSANEGSTRKKADYYGRRAGHILLDAIETTGMNAELLALRLLELGYEHPKPKHLLQRIKRGDFSASFFLRVLTVVQLDHLDLKGRVRLISRADEKKLTRDKESARVVEKAVRQPRKKS